MTNTLKIIFTIGISYFFLQSCVSESSSTNSYAPQQSYKAPQYDESKGGVIVEEPEYVGTREDQKQKILDQQKRAVEERERSMARLKQQNAKAREEAARKAQQHNQSTPTTTPSTPNRTYSGNNATQAYQAMQQMIRDPQYIKKNGKVDRGKVKNALNDMGYRQANGKKFHKNDIPKHY